ncbi:Adenosine receptor A2a [Larimichthys crocea]|uniref:Uncharacterized protein n=1 Tax=Larimichthys crocea TaxID=215358 RepID=A0ACD3QNM3_LARCR|nr:Adenosine receptor A2a [Larimichthys crocea]
MKTQRKHKRGKNNHAEECPAGLYWPGGGDRLPGCCWEHPGLLGRLASTPTCKASPTSLWCHWRWPILLWGCWQFPSLSLLVPAFCANFFGCLFIACFVLILTQSSIFSLLAIAVDRYIAIKNPLRYSSVVTGQRAKGIIALCWILSIGIGLTPMLGWNRSRDWNSTCFNQQQQLP